MSGWPDLVAVALLGTERREPPSLDLLDVAGTPEERLLGGAGGLATYRRAGARPEPAPALGDVALEDTGPVLGAAPATRLRMLLDGRRPLLDEWLRAVGSQGLRVPPEFLPELLEWGSGLSEPYVAPVIGKRGRWLASRNPRWKWAAEPPSDEDDRAAIWRQGKAAERVRLLATVRREAPAAGLALLQTTWGEERDRRRVDLIHALRFGLSHGDEVFLESALDDPDPDVAETARKLLSSLSGSALLRRMGERARAVVRVSGRRKPKLGFDLSAAFDDEASRDGLGLHLDEYVDQNQAPSRVRDLGYLAPLSIWAELGISADDVVRLMPPPTRDEREPEVEVLAAFCEGLAHAGHAQDDPAWTQAVAIAALRAGDWHLAEEVAKLLPAPWPHALSEQALEAFASTPVSRRPFMAGIDLAARVDPSLADHAQRRFDKLQPDARQLLGADRVLDTLFFRRDMYEELR